MLSNGPSKNASETQGLAPLFTSSSSQSSLTNSPRHSAESSSGARTLLGRITTFLCSVPMMRNLNRILQRSMQGTKNRVKIVLRDRPMLEFSLSVLLIYLVVIGLNYFWITWFLRFLVFATNGRFYADVFHNHHRYVVPDPVLELCVESAYLHRREVDDKLEDHLRVNVDNDDDSQRSLSHSTSKSERNDDMSSHRSRSLLNSSPMVSLPEGVKVFGQRIPFPSDWSLKEHLSDQCNSVRMDSNRNRIPKILHQTYRSLEELPERWKETTESWQYYHSDWEYWFWNDEAIAEFIQTEYEWFMPLYESYEAVIQRADIMRYFVLFHYGGFYSDFDILPVTNIEPLLIDYDSVLVETPNLGQTNSIFGAKRHSDFLSFLISRLPIYRRQWFTWILPRHARILYSTGPTMFWTVYSLYSQLHSRNEVNGLENGPAYDTKLNSHADRMGIVRKQHFGRHSICDVQPMTVEGLERSRQRREDRMKERMEHARREGLMSHILKSEGTSGMMSDESENNEGGSAVGDNTDGLRSVVSESVSHQCLAHRYNPYFRHTSGNSWHDGASFYINFYFACHPIEAVFVLCGFLWFATRLCFGPSSRARSKKWREISSEKGCFAASLQRWLDWNSRKSAKKSPMDVTSDGSSEDSGGLSNNSNNLQGVPPSVIEHRKKNVVYSPLQSLNVSSNDNSSDPENQKPDLFERDSDDPMFSTGKFKSRARRSIAFGRGGWISPELMEWLKGRMVWIVSWVMVLLTLTFSAKVLLFFRGFSCS